MIPDIVPWYRGFTGKIEKSDNKYVSYGTIEQEKGGKCKVTELPVGMWTDKFKEMCEDLLVDKKIKAMKNNSSYNTIDFTITESEDGIKCSIDNLKLYSYLHITNMVLFNENEQIKKYTVETIIDDFCKMRYKFYTKRKNHIISTIEKELKILGNKARFVQEIIDDKLNIMNVEETEVVKELEKRGYDKDTKIENDEEDNKNNGYEYLLRLQVRTFTANKVKQLKDDIDSLQKKLEEAKSITEKQMWLKDIEEFEQEYEKWLKIMNNLCKDTNKTKSKKK
jgi:DNA topoisomerase-2